MAAFSTNLHLIPRVSATTRPERPAHLIRIALPRLNKQDTIAGYIREMKARDYDTAWAEVEETRVLGVAEWNELMGNLLQDRDWLAGKGGAGNWDPQYEGMTHVQICNMDKARMEEYRSTVYLSVVEVVAPTGQKIYIDPQGYNYARYVGFLADGLPDGKTREELRRERAKAEAERIAAEKAERLANPIIPPADHGLKFYWNGIKHAGGPLQKCQYNANPGGICPPGTIAVYAKDYERFTADIARCFHVYNDSDSQSDYFTDDKFYVVPSHQLYAQVKAAYEACEEHRRKRKEKRGW